MCSILPRDLSRTSSGDVYAPKKRKSGSKFKCFSHLHRSRSGSPHFAHSLLFCSLTRCCSLLHSPRCIVAAAALLRPLRAALTLAGFVQLCAVSFSPLSISRTSTFNVCAPLPNQSASLFGMWRSCGWEAEDKSQPRQRCKFRRRRWRGQWQLQQTRDETATPAACEVLRPRECLSFFRADKFVFSDL